ncbi:Uncharacterised protein [Bordetella pertussis]|nr:Uncharacterised protein [Bordetella pertussis]CFO67165.1 Uncharacterised protein [Bordetella pertussis]CFU87919.1 Uncharacterised protein [Bordetella pertussis]CPI36161.1 Uncharacterised protein [Bordetella pertussis]CPK90246.1 Uncharacterised protein [Bordetella pertussis]
MSNGMAGMFLSKNISVGTNGLVEILPRPKKMLSTTSLRLNACITACRTLMLSKGGLRMLKMR